MGTSFFSKTSLLLLMLLFNLHNDLVYSADQELLDILLKNGTITEQQYEQLSKKSKLDKEDINDIVVKLDARGFRYVRIHG